MSRRRRRHKPVEHESHEAWAIPYGDLVTLLLAFFVVMYAMSSVNEGKYRVLSDSMVAAFRGTPRMLKPIQLGDRQAGPHTDQEVNVVQQALLDGQPRELLQMTPGATDASSFAIRRMAEQVETALGALIDANQITVRRTAYGVEVDIRADILFPSGSAALAPSAQPVLQQVAATLRGLPNPLRVEGHTDDVPVRSGSPFPSNWELSAARAASVVHLFTDHGLAPDRLAVVAYGEQRPVQPNTTAEGRNANRRVLIVVLGTEPVQETSVEGGEAGTETAVVRTEPQLRDGNPSPAAL